MSKFVWTPVVAVCLKYAVLSAVGCSPLVDGKFGVVGGVIAPEDSSLFETDVTTSGTATDKDRLKSMLTGRLFGF